MKNSKKEASNKKTNKVIKLANQLQKELKPYCKRIKLAGSIRRKEKNPKDIDIVIIPKDKEKIFEILDKKGKKLQAGDKKVYFKINGIKVEIYYTNEKSWGATLLAYSSKKGAAIGLRILARKKGFKLNQYGLFKKTKKNNKKTWKYIAGKTEKEIYNALDRKWKPPEER
ncbi:MAG: hypothetical protein ACOC1P_02695 [Minisyncoccales bacterium]